MDGSSLNWCNAATASRHLTTALALRCSREQTGLHTLIHQRHLTPSCGGHAPTAERTLEPGTDVTESLTPRPELENGQDQQALRGVLEPGLDVDAVGPEVDVTLGGEVAVAPRAHTPPTRPP